MTNDSLERYWGEEMWFVRFPMSYLYFFPLILVFLLCIKFSSPLLVTFSPFQSLLYLLQFFGIPVICISGLIRDLSRNTKITA